MFGELEKTQKAQRFSNKCPSSKILDNYSLVIHGFHFLATMSRQPLNVQWTEVFERQCQKMNDIKEKEASVDVFKDRTVHVQRASYHVVKITVA